MAAARIGDLTVLQAVQRVESWAEELPEDDTEDEGDDQS